MDLTKEELEIARHALLEVTSGAYAIDNEDEFLTLMNCTREQAFEVMKKIKAIVKS